MASNVGIQDFYAGKSVFITGATGFVGKALIEKLVRSCPQIGRLYLLIRPAQGKDARFRLKELLECEIFEWLKKNQPESLEKLIPINGDVSLPDLGISSSDMQELEENITVVFNSAARVKFDYDLRTAMESNVKGPITLCTFCQRLKNLKVLLHVSTTYNNLDKKDIEEKVYPAVIDPKKWTDFLDSMDTHLLNSITKQLLGNCPNVYSYTKALSEQILKNECDAQKIPLVIVRPSIVSAALSEPLPGWIENMNGATGIFVGVWKGLIRTLKSNYDHIFDLIPIDTTVNLIITAAWDKATDVTLEKSVIVYNCSTGSLNPLKWKDIRNWSVTAMLKFPCKEIMWYPSINFRTNSFVFNMEVAFYHQLPAFINDAISVFCGKKPFLTRLYRKLHKAMQCTEFYTTHEWNFVSHNPIKLMKKMNDEDKENFNFDVQRINWESYLGDYVSGIRTYILKDHLSTLPAARENLKRLKRLRTVVWLIIIGLILYFFLVIFSGLPSILLIKPQFPIVKNISAISGCHISAF